MAFEAKQPIYLPVGDFLELQFHLMDTRPGVKPDAFVTELVQRWLAIEIERLALRKNGQAMRGFQWKVRADAYRARFTEQQRRRAIKEVDASELV